MNNQICVTARWVGEMSVEWKVQGVVGVKMLWGLSSNEVFGSVHGLDEKSLHTFANIGIVDFEKTVLKSSTACGVNFITDLVHTVGECLESSWIGCTLTAKKSTIRKTFRNLLCYIAICLVKQLLNEFMGRSGIKNVVFNWNILIIELIDESEWSDSLSIRSKSLFTEFLGNGL